MALALTPTPPERENAQANMDLNNMIVNNMTVNNLPAQANIPINPQANGNIHINNNDRINNNGRINNNDRINNDRINNDHDINNNGRINNDHDNDSFDMDALTNYDGSDMDALTIVDTPTMINSNIDNINSDDDNNDDGVVDDNDDDNDSALRVPPNLPPMSPPPRFSSPASTSSIPALFPELELFNLDTPPRDPRNRSSRFTPYTLLSPNFPIQNSRRVRISEDCHVFTIEHLPGTSGEVLCDVQSVRNKLRVPSISHVARTLFNRMRVPSVSHTRTSVHAISVHANNNAHTNNNAHIVRALSPMYN